MKITDNRIKNITNRNRVFSSKLGFFALNLNMIKTVTAALLLLVGLTSIFLLTATQAIAKGPGTIKPNPQPIGTIAPVTVNVGDGAVTRNVVKTISTMRRTMRTTGR